MCLANNNVDGMGFSRRHRWASSGSFILLCSWQRNGEATPLPTLISSSIMPVPSPGEIILRQVVYVAVAKCGETLPCRGLAASIATPLAGVCRETRRYTF